MRPVKLSELGVKVPSRRLILPGTAAEIAREMIHSSVQRAIPAPYALPVGFAMFLAVGTAAAGLHGRLPATGVLIACATVAGAMSSAAEGFSRPPYAQLRPAGPAAAHAAIVIGASALACACLGLVFRWYARRLTLVSMGTYTGMRA